MKLSTLKGKVQTVRITIPADGDEPEDYVTVSFRPGAMTFDVIERIQGLAGTGSDTTVVAELLHTVLVSWDLEEDILGENGEPTGDVRQLSTSIEDIRKVPLPFLGMLMEKITEESRGNPQRDATSASTSPQTAEQEASQSGSFS